MARDVNRLQTTADQQRGAEKALRAGQLAERAQRLARSTTIGGCQHGKFRR
jgi:hypothetical protein